ncbi:catalase [Xanthobacter pseudotagetidis]|uniref:catalase n=1 Tax=Xanthobacter pseudotagetidis TaxID=3119911 RepID=UPI003727D058
MGSPEQGTAKILTNRQGHPIVDNQNSRSVGESGPLLLENYNFLEKIASFNRERVPERVVHARGAGAFGTFRAYGRIGEEPAETYTRAKVLTDKERETEVFVRFSTVVGGGHSPETTRDPRGFATKFYTPEGNWDLVGNNHPVFFIRDPIKFPDLIHASRPDPVTNRFDPNRRFDWVSNTPEALLVTLMTSSMRGVPKGYRFMNGFGVHTFKLINAEGVATLVRFSWISQQGCHGFTQHEAHQVQATNIYHATEDLHQAIERGEFPAWELCVQLMSDDEHPELPFDPCDPTKVWPERDFPLLPVGRLVLNRNPQDYFTEVEQSAFSPGVVVDGIGMSNDKLLIGRTFAYSDSQRYRIGPNYLQLPINRPKCPVATNYGAGPMAYRVDSAAAGVDAHINYEPSGGNALREAPAVGVPHEPFVAGHVTHKKIARRDDYSQCRDFFHALSEFEQQDLLHNLVHFMMPVRRELQERMLAHFDRIDTAIGDAIGQGLGLRKAVPVPEAVS